MSIKIPNHLDPEEWEIVQKSMERKYSDFESFEKLLEEVSGFRFKVHSIRQLPENKIDEFFSFTLPIMQKTVLIEVKKEFPNVTEINFPSKRKLYLTKSQIFCILCCYFLGLLNEKRIFKIYQNKSICATTQIECVMCYVREFMKTKEVEGDFMVEFLRKIGPKYDILTSSEYESRLLRNVIFHSSIPIEECKTSHKVAFANARTGGKFFQSALLQEEIRISQNPELIILPLLKCETNDSRSTISAKGTTQYSFLRGYAYTSRFLSSRSDNMEKNDENKNNISEVVVDGKSYQIYNNTIIFMDSSMNFERNGFNISVLRRDLEKALSGFLCQPDDQGISISTGHWGCGAFRHLPARKFIEQWITTSIYEDVQLEYCCFKKKKFEREAKKFHDEMLKLKVTVKELYLVLEESGGNISNKSFFDEVLEKIIEKKG